LITLNADLAGDVKVGIGAIKDVSFLSIPPFEGLTQVFDMRGIGNKAFFVILDDLSAFLFTRASVFYVISFKAFYFLFLALICYLIARGSNATKPTVALFIAAALASSYQVQIQADFTAAILLATLALRSLRLSEIEFSRIILVSLLVTSLKYPNAILLGSFLLVLFGYDLLRSNNSFIDTLKKGLARLAIAVVTVISYLCIVFVFLKQEWEDMMSAPLFQNSLGVAFEDRVNILRESVFKGLAHSPSLLAAAFVVLVFAGEGLRSQLGGRRNRTRVINSRKIIAPTLLLFGAIWPLFQIFIQAKGFRYHYSAFIPISLFILIKASEQSPHGILFKRTKYLSSPISLILLIPLLTPFSLVSPDRDAHILNILQKYQNEITHIEEIQDVKFNKQCPGQLVFLEPGFWSYYLPQSSFLRYSYPLPLHRRNPDLEGHELRKNLLEELDTFEGACVVWNEEWLWTRNNGRPWLNDFKSVVESEFIELEKIRSVRIYQRKDL